MDNYIGMKLDGRYELLELIGTGGMAEIYKADDTYEDKTVAVKILKNEFSGSDEFLRRFRNESKAIALLSHPNIVKNFDVGLTEGVQFIVMEYIDGITLIDYIQKQGVLKWREALGFVRQILKALQHAHDRGIVHRDVKSQNVMLLRDGTIKVMDFGIARFNREIDKTMSEKAIGSVHYISPEQARGDKTDEKSDLYSVGVMLYEMLTGIKPFDGNDALAIALMHTNKTPKRPMEINSSIPEGLEEITLRAMQKEPVKRYQTAGEMMNDLQEFEKNPSVIFEYKYFTPDGNTKYFDKVGKPVAAAPPAKPVAVEETFDDDDDEYDDEVGERRSPLLPILFAVASAFVILAGVVVALIVGGTIGGARNQEMPDLYGRDYNEVVRSYDWMRLVPRQEPSADYPKDTIMEQSVRAGSMFNPTQTEVVVRVSSGKEVVFFPDLTSGPMRSGEDVAAELRRLGLRVIPVEVFDTEIPAGYFISSDREYGDELAVNDIVRIRVSKGDEDNLHNTRVPDFLWLSEHVARDNAQRNQITVTTVTRESSEEMLGRVIEQSVPEGTEVQIWSVVELVIGSGPAEIPPEEQVREFFIGFAIPDDIPDRWKGDYEFKHYINGIYQPDETKVFNIAIQRDIRWDFENSGVHNYSIAIRNPRNGLEFVYCVHIIDFTTSPNPTRDVRESNVNIFAQLNPAETTDEPHHTDEPHYTEEPYPPSYD
jgi:serine/threonine-protein kinase